MERYKQLVAELYIEPKEEQILGSFLERNPENQNNPPGEKEPNQQRKKSGSGMKDIRSFFFSSAERKHAERTETG